MLIKLGDFKKDILSQNPHEYKYLSPHIFKLKSKFYLLYCNRKSKLTFYGEINVAISSNLKNWEKLDTIFLKPRKIEYRSFVSPSIIEWNGKFYLFVEAQKNNKSSIIVYLSKNFKSWSICSKFKLKNIKNNYYSPYAIKIKDKIYCYYSVNKKHIYCNILDQNLKVEETFLCFSKSNIDEKNCIYAPMVIKYKKKYLLFYSAFRNLKSSNIKIATSIDGKKWNKKPKLFFELNEKIQIISEPFGLIYKQIFYMFFEYKISDKWNVGLKSFNLKILDKWKL
tara:strand:+ start:12595 stop:13437 length:843 start_codon:yes stop_codon:yes gene_type:complete